jgi:outer membrane immunogenic protein
MCISAPAIANEGRVEIRGGYTSVISVSKPVVGAAVGYDFDLGSDAFIGGEVSVDEVLNFAPINEVEVGLTARAGFKVAEKTRLYANGGYSFGNGGSLHAGFGAEHTINDKFFVKLEHRRNFTNTIPFDFDSTYLGFGIKF